MFFETMINMGNGMRIITRGFEPRYYLLGYAVSIPFLREILRHEIPHGSELHCGIQTRNVIRYSPIRVSFLKLIEFTGQGFYFHQLTFILFPSKDKRGITFVLFTIFFSFHVKLIPTQRWRKEGLLEIVKFLIYCENPPFFSRFNIIVL